MAKLYMMTEQSPFMMGFVFLTDGGKAVVIDGGRPEDMPQLLELVGDRKIEAWILTHPHLDHIWGFVDEIEKGDIIDKIGEVYYNFPSQEFVMECEPKVQPCSIIDFNRIKSKIAEKLVVVHPEDKISIDELNIEFLFAGEERYTEPNISLAVNNSSIAFKVTGKGMKDVLFLGDLGPSAGKDLLKVQGDNLKADIVQMAHHGHSGVTEEVYKKIAPEICLWCAPDWLWEEDDVEFAPESWGTKHQRKWMDQMGCKHYVSKDGIQQIPILEEKKQ